MAPIGSPHLQVYDRQPSTTDERPLHPEIHSIVSLITAHAEKIYFSGPLIHKLEKNPHGHKPYKDEDWHDVWAQIYGTTLSIWDMVEVKKAHREGREVPPSYVNLTDAVRPPFIHTIHATQRIRHPSSSVSSAR
jgi:CCR4-NOT transcriptional complex subunit CAF120